MSLKDSFEKYDAKISSNFFKETPNGKEPQWIRIIVLWICLMAIASIIFYSVSSASVYMVEGELFDYPSNYELTEYATGQLVYSSQGSFAIAYNHYGFSPEDMQVATYNNTLKDGKSPELINREYNGVSYYGVKYVEDSTYTESGYFESNGLTRQYIIIGNPPQEDIDVFFNNIHL